MLHSFILTGFLGVGKTTMLVNTIQTQFKDKKVALIVNEFGEVGIDGTVLKNVHSEVLEISEGCICCTLSNEFNQGVQEIIKNYNPEILFVETSGASEPLPIFLALHKLGISVEGVLCVIDSKNFHTYKHHETARHQIGSSNIILLNKTDLVTQDELITVETEVIKIKKTCDARNALTKKPIFKGYVLQHTKQGVVNAKIFEGLYKQNDIIELDTVHQHHNHTQENGITQKIAYIKKDVTKQELNTLLSSLPKNVYRAKGIVKLSNATQPQLVNYAFGYTTYENLEDYEGESTFIFIGDTVEKDIISLEKMVDCLVIPSFKVTP